MSRKKERRRTQALSPEAEALIQRIEAVFDGVMLEDGVGLHQSVAVDLYQKAEEVAAARRKDVADDWRRLVGSKKLRDTWGVGGPVFLDAAGLRFHLPAYLVTLLRDPRAPVADTLHRTLIELGAYNRDRLAILTQEQRAVVGAYLEQTGQAEALSAGARRLWGLA